jgi:pyruvate kinase
MYHKKTKIVATLGPASWNRETLGQMIDAGLNVARLNFSHGSLEEKKTQVDLIRSLSKEKNAQVAILADLPGPKLRLGVFEGQVTIEKNEEVILSTEEKKGVLPLQYDFSDSIKVNDRVYLNDGLIALIVTKVSGKDIYCTALNNGWVTSKKGVNLPDTIISGAAFEQKDQESAEFALSIGVDFIALSFVQTPEDVLKARALITEKKSNAKIIVKIEKPEAVKNLEAIIKAADGVMVARGDLAIETSAAEVPLIQQRITKIARHLQKPVIVATQMLESMIENPRPTRAEASDVANAVLSQVDAVMLSAESASGKYPVEAVAMLTEIITTVEKNPEFRRYIKLNWETIEGETLRDNAIAAASASLAYRLQAKSLAVGTVTGRTAGFMSSFRPDCLIVAMSNDEAVCRQLSLWWGVKAVLVNATAKTKNFASVMKETLITHEFAEKGDRVVLVWGSEIGVSGTTESIRVVEL